MDEIKQRLKDASDACIATYEAWRGKPNDHASREALQEAVHDLRKVAARVEIELAVNERQQSGNDPIPIPAHRASRRPGQGGGDGDNGQDGGRNRDRGGRDRDDNRKSVPIRSSKQDDEGGPQPGNSADAAEGGQDKAPRRGGGKPLSLKRGNDGE